MVHFGTAIVVDPIRDVTPFGARTIPSPHCILVVRDTERNSEYLNAVCEFLDIGVEHASPSDDLGSLLFGLRPMALIADLEGQVSDGYHAMKMAAEFDTALPVLLLTANEPVLLGAVDAVREVWGLKNVTTLPGAGDIGELVDFVCRAARDAGRSRLMRS